MAPAIIPICEGLELDLWLDDWSLVSVEAVPFPEEEEEL
jgi:hypothetical protein